MVKLNRIVQERTFFPVKLRIARAIKGYSVNQLSRISGVHSKTIHRLERQNDGRIHVSTFKKLAAALGMEEEFYFTDVDEAQYDGR